MIPPKFTALSRIIDHSQILKRVPWSGLIKHIYLIWVDWSWHKPISCLIVGDEFAATRDDQSKLQRDQFFVGSRFHPFYLSREARMVMRWARPQTEESDTGGGCGYWSVYWRYCIDRFITTYLSLMQRKIPHLSPPDGWIEQETRYTWEGETK